MAELFSMASEVVAEVSSTAGQVVDEVAAETAGAVAVAERGSAAAEVGQGRVHT